MLQLFLTSVLRYLRLILVALTPVGGGAGTIVRRLLTMIVFLPLFGAVQAVNWLGLLLDEIFFRGYRRVRIDAPVFVLGVPRSGTTHLHRVLARDGQFTTFSTWECLFAPSVSQRVFWRGVARLDARIGRPLGRGFDWLLARAAGGLEDVHAVSLDAPEEDYFVFLPLMTCFILMVPFPRAEWLWRQAYFDRDVPEPERRRVMAYYRACVRKHLYFHGPHKRFLSKNASFAPMVGSLRETFPDARVVCCLRDPGDVLRSQVSSIRGGVALFANDPVLVLYRERLTAALRYYYENLFDTLDARPDGCVYVPMPALKDGLVDTVTQTYEALGLDMGQRFRDDLAMLASEARTFRSRHRYSHDDFGVSDAFVHRAFADVEARFDFATDRPSTPPSTPPARDTAQGATAC